MKTTMLMTTAAAALLLTASAAPGQTLKNIAPEPAPAAQRNAPAEKIAPPMHAGQRKMLETTGRGPQALEPGSGSNTDLKGTVVAGARADDGAKAKGGSKADTKAGAVVKTQQSDGSADAKASSSSGRSAADKSDASQQSDKSAGGESKATVGQGAAAGSAKLSSQQRSEITTIIQKQGVKRIEPAELNVSIRVGARVPSHVHFYPVPARVVAIYPAWEGYRFILVGGQILIIDLGSYEIVAILAA